MLRQRKQNIQWKKFYKTVTRRHFLKESVLDCKTLKYSGPPILGEFVKNLKTEVEHLKEELTQRGNKIFLGLGLKGLAVALKI